MLFYAVIRPTFISSGTVLALTPEQASCRHYGVEGMPNNRYKATQTLCFKAGEVLGFETVPKRWLLTLQPIVEKTEPAVCKVQQNVRVMPAGLSCLEQVAWQSVWEAGQLTIQAYQKKGGAISRRSLQRVLTGMVDKHLFVREGSTHHVVYRLAED